MAVSSFFSEKRCPVGTYVFDIRAGVDGDHVTVLHPQVVANDSVDASAAIVQLIVGEDDQDGVLSLLAAHEHGVTTEKLESLHGVLGEGNDGVVIVDGIGNPASVSVMKLAPRFPELTYISWLGFFFFLRIAVAVSSCCLLSQYQNNYHDIRLRR